MKKVCVYCWGWNSCLFAKHLLNILSSFRILGVSCLKSYRPYKNDTKLLKKLAEAAGITPFSVKRLAYDLCLNLGVDFPCLTFEEWRRRFGKQS